MCLSAIDAVDWLKSKGDRFNKTQMPGSSRVACSRTATSTHAAGRALLRVAWVTAGLAESNGSLPPGL